MQMQMKKSRGRQAAKKDKLQPELVKDGCSNPESSSKHVAGKQGGKPAGDLAEQGVRKHIFSEVASNHNNSNCPKDPQPCGHPVTRSSALNKLKADSGMLKASQL